MARIYLLREGFSHSDDRISARAFYPLKDGPIAGRTLDAEEMSQAMQHYFKKMGWDQEGVPSSGVLEELDIREYLK